MPISSATVLAKVRDIVAGVTGMEPVFSQGDTDGTALPVAINQFPAALVMFGGTTNYQIMNRHHKHTYQVRIVILEREADFGGAASSILGFVDKLIEAFVPQQKLAGNATVQNMQGASPFGSYAWGGVEYMAIEVTITVVEDADATPGVGT